MAVFLSRTFCEASSATYVTYEQNYQIGARRAAASPQLRGALPQGRPRRVPSTQSVSPQNLQRLQTFPRHRLQASVAVPRPRGISTRGRRRNDLGRRDGNVSAVFRGRRRARSVCIQRPAPFRRGRTPARKTSADPGTPSSCTAIAGGMPSSSATGTGAFGIKGTQHRPPVPESLASKAKVYLSQGGQSEVEASHSTLAQGHPSPPEDHAAPHSAAVVCEASELFVTNFLSASYLFSLHAKRKTLMRKDVIFLQDLQDIWHQPRHGLLNFSADFIYLFIYPQGPEAL
ncbi:uncharacterized protein LOC115328698 [Ixodes scapularis]|uniref:uncharacterized protein LOC115328698 n=1 Tax=Ixodes scapularis TaxID=6945 RepID=UPI001A9E7D24|nr:uncharacterized protein LOC115328698 [Ixodes scapularis]